MSHMTTHALRSGSVSAHIATLNDQARLPTLARVFVALAVVVTKWDKRASTRRALGRLGPHELNDIGLTRSAAQAEADKPFWQG